MEKLNNLKKFLLGNFLSSSALLLASVALALSFSGIYFSIGSLRLAKNKLRQQKNLFNNRLSRTIEAIGYDGLAIRNNGLRLLHNHGKDAQKRTQAG